MSTLKWRRSNARALHLSGMARLLWFRVDGAMKFIKNEDVSALITSQELRTNINLEIKNGAFEPKTLSEFLGCTQFWTSLHRKHGSKIHTVAENKTNHWIIFVHAIWSILEENKIRNMQLEKFERSGHVGAGCILSLLSSVHSAEWKWWSQYTNIAPFAQTLWVSPGAGDRNLAWMPKSITLTYDNGIAGWYNPIV